MAALVVRIAGMAVVFGATLFLAAGTIAWPGAWTLLALFFSFVIALSAWLLRFDPGLLAERLTGVGKSDQKTWDKDMRGSRGTQSRVGGSSLPHQSSLPPGRRGL